MILDEQRFIKDMQRHKELVRLCRDGSPQAMARYDELMREIGEENKRLDQQRHAQHELQRQAANQQINAKNNALKQLTNGKVLATSGDLRTTNLYRKSQVLYDITVLFCTQFVTDYHDRTKDQMIQAARSGKQNFIEGWEDGKNDTGLWLNLFSVGKGSLQELREDYEDYLRVHGLPLWDAHHPRYRALVSFCRERNDVQDYQAVWPKMNDEELANMALTLLHQVDRMADSFIKMKEREVLAGSDATSVRKALISSFRPRGGFWR